MGEAGGLLATDLVRAGTEVVAYDPAEVSTPEGVTRVAHPSLGARNADLVVGVTAASDATLALLQAIDVIRDDAVYADMSTGSPQLKSELAGFAAKRDLDFADVALMAMVPGNGLATPALASGTGAGRYCDVINSVGGKSEELNGPPGTAAAKKLLRSVMMKGTAAVLIEAVRAGAALDDLDWLWSNIRDELGGADEKWMRRLATGSKVHASRRKAEMEAAASMLDELDVAPVMTRATIASLTELLDGELPDLPSDYPAPTHRS